MTHSAMQHTLIFSKKTPAQRDALIDEAMRKYKEVFGQYPAVVGSWLIDTRTACRLADRYGVKGLWICRDHSNDL